MKWLTNWRADRWLRHGGWWLHTSLEGIAQLSSWVPGLVSVKYDGNELYGKLNSGKVIHIPKKPVNDMTAEELRAELTAFGHDIDPRSHYARILCEQIAASQGWDYGLWCTADGLYTAYFLTGSGERICVGSSAHSGLEAHARSALSALRAIRK